VGGQLLPGCLYGGRKLDGASQHQPRARHKVQPAVQQTTDILVIDSSFIEEGSFGQARAPKYVIPTVQASQHCNKDSAPGKFSI
jgi:hypothetical protein